jgi:hypothetical protein
VVQQLMWLPLPLSLLRLSCSRQHMQLLLLQHLQQSGSLEDLPAGHRQQ